MKYVLILFLVVIVSTAFSQNEEGLEITNIKINGGITSTQPLLPDDLKYDGLELGVCLWWDRCGLDGGMPYTLLDAPEYVLNETYLLMTANDKWTQDVPNYLICTVNMDVTMYVLYDARQRADAEYFPSWLEEWEMLQDSVIVNDCYGDSCKPRLFDIYKMDFPPGDIALGSNNENGYDFSALQYIPVWSVAEGGGSSVETTQPREFELVINNYPNPFNPETRIEFSLPKRGEVNLAVFNLLGTKVTTLVDTEMEAGQHQLSWSAVDAQGELLPSGAYFIRLETPDAVTTGKMILTR